MVTIILKTNLVDKLNNSMIEKFKSLIIKELHIQGNKNFGENNDSLKI